MAVIYDVITGYFLERNKVGVGFFPTFADAIRAAEDGDHIHMICGRGDGARGYNCKHTGCVGTVAPFPEALCDVCRSY